MSVEGRESRSTERKTSLYEPQATHRNGYQHGYHDRVDDMTDQTHTADFDALTTVIRRNQMVPYDDGKGGHLFRGIHPEELAAVIHEWLTETPVVQRLSALADEYDARCPATIDGRVVACQDGHSHGCAVLPKDVAAAIRGCVYPPGVGE